MAPSDASVVCELPDGHKEAEDKRLDELAKRIQPRSA